MECKHFIIYTKGGGHVKKNAGDRECDRERDKIVGNGEGEGGRESARRERREEDGGQTPISQFWKIFHELRFSLSLNIHDVFLVFFMVPR